ncbi:hypothetical protein MNV_2200005 [Candidatus Methanoperedens nitroreducens]|uniref:Uncharacterized protein n=1 Tax=Candidatus Methanoperedens nitratireducens TaxID=1392998 RepID=A0A284VP96_9EURY|nr:hypothetical protein MNV_2200005 [Candidatus Methanoperedens nitroreducens]
MIYLIQLKNLLQKAAGHQGQHVITKHLMKAYLKLGESNKAL